MKTPLLAQIESLIAYIAHVNKPALLAGIVLILGASAHADTVAVTFAGVGTGVNDGVDYVLPYQLMINGITLTATCYDVYDDVNFGQSWTANELTLAGAAASGQFSNTPDALTSYREIGFLSQQVTSSAQDQIDLQHDIWNVFAPARYAVTPGMQAYLDLLTTSAFGAFDFNSVRFLEDVNQTSPVRVQAFVIDPPASAPEPGTTLLLGSSLVLLSIGAVRKKKFRIASL